MHDTRSFYDRIASAYDLIADASEHRARERGLELLAPRPGERVLEVGFGTGHALVDLARAAGPAGHVHGIDLSKGMARVSRARLEDELRSGAAPTSLVLGDAAALPYREATFDAAFLSFTLELFGAEIPTVLAQLRRCLRPNGRLGVVAMLSREDEGPVVHVYRWLHRHFPHIVDCEPIDVRRHVEGAGFAVDVLETTSLWGLPVAMAVATP